MILNKIKCQFFGHKLNEIGLDHGYLDCERCKMQGFYPDNLKGEEIYTFFRKKSWFIRRRFIEIFRKIKWKYYDFKHRNDEDIFPF